MTKERLELLGDDILANLAEKIGVRSNPEWDRSELISAVIDVMDEERMEKESLLNLALSIESKKYSIAIDEELDLSYDVDEEMFLPERYNETMLHLLLRDNSWGFILWDIEDSVVQKNQMVLGDFSYVLRVIELDQETYDKDAVIDFFDIVVGHNEKKRYVSLPHEESYYCVELLLVSEFQEIKIIRSEIVKTFRDHVNFIPGVNDKLKSIVELSGFSFSDVASKKSRSLNRILPIDSMEGEV